ncbi:MAG: hypothetical protein QE263_06000 [Vampirovibrionales bacterium]|nr:hypothetical protein [Vampirovibrionales bacterium]
MAFWNLFTPVSPTGKTGKSKKSGRGKHRYRGFIRFWDDLKKDAKDVATFTSKKTNKKAPRIITTGKFRPLVWVLGALGVATAVVYPSIKDGVVTAGHGSGGHGEHGEHGGSGVSSGFMDGAKGLITRALGFIGGAALLSSLTQGLVSRNKWGRGAALLAKVVGIVGGGALGAWAAIKAFPNKAAKIEHHAEEKHESKELFDTMKNKELEVVPFTAMPASKLAHSSDAVQNAFFAGMAKQTMDFTVHEKPLHSFFEVKTPFDYTTSPFGDVSYENKPHEGAPNHHGTVEGDEIHH